VAALRQWLRLQQPSDLQLQHNYQYLQTSFT
jgi:hypothetical protein